MSERTKLFKNADVSNFITYNKLDNVKKLKRIVLTIKYPDSKSPKVNSVVNYPMAKDHWAF